ncbi:RDD domain-containing membrane protein [Streptomyces sp. 150FB]|nr:RDD family protein [Streptomyces sp. 150FB]KIF74628.1 RDD domain-containing membrane protein [Streptomyces sp. 150FB]
MSNDQPPPGQPPPEDDDPFRKRPRGPGEPLQDPVNGSSGAPGQGPGSDPGPGSGSGPGSDPGPGAGPGPGSGPGSPYGDGRGNPPPAPPYDPNAYGGDPYGGGTDPLAGMPPLPTFARRLLARVIDAVVVFIPLVIISLIFGGFRMSDSNDEWNGFPDQVNTGWQWGWTLISLVAYVGYDTVMISKNGQTLGKRWLGLRVGMLNNGAVPPTNASLVRAAVLWVPALLVCYCVWWLVIAVTILVSRPYKQGWHDKAARTVVVTARR